MVAAVAAPDDETDVSLGCGAEGHWRPAIGFTGIARPAVLRRSRRVGPPQGKLVAVFDAASAGACGGDAVGLAAGALAAVVAVPIEGALLIGVGGRPHKP